MKNAFFSMDVESLYDAEVLKKTNNKYDEKYSYEECILNYIELLNKYNIKATFFITYTSINKIKDIIPTLIKEGHEIAIHAKKHVSPIKQDNDEFLNDIKMTKEYLESNYNIKIKGYRAPCFGITDDKLKIIKDLDFKYDSSFMNFSLQLNAGTININDYEKIGSTIYKKDNFYEFMLSKSKVLNGSIPISGGGYLRLIPFFFINHYLKKYIKKNNSYIFYCHPFEVSNGKLPKFSGLSFVERSYINHNRGKYLKRIEKIIKYLIKNNYEFNTFEQYIEKATR